jgi:hypothetical protein
MSHPLCRAKRPYTAVDLEQSIINVGRATRASTLNMLQFGFDDLSPTLPNRGVAMVYLALEHN